MDTFSDETLCRICFKKQDTVFSLFHKRKGISPCEKLNKIGVKADFNDTGPSCICCGCLTELETTVNFLEKCERSNRMLAEHLADVLQENESNMRHEMKSDEVFAEKEARCEECGSRRRCPHWAPPATHTCPKCQKVFNRKFNFKLHMQRHSPSRAWWCAACGAGAPAPCRAAGRPTPLILTSMCTCEDIVVRDHSRVTNVGRSSPARILYRITSEYTQVRYHTSVPYAASSSARTSCQRTWPPTAPRATAARAAASASRRAPRCSATRARTRGAGPAPPRPPRTRVRSAPRATTTSSPSTST